jgi:hypothetical protein
MCEAMALEQDLNVLRLRRIAQTADIDTATLLNSASGFTIVRHVVVRCLTSGDACEKIRVCPVKESLNEARHDNSIRRVKVEHCQQQAVFT